MSLRGLPGLVLILLLGPLAAARAQEAREGQRVRIVLGDGTELEGELLGFEARVWQLQLQGGARRAIPERLVRRVTFLDGPQADGSRALGAVLRAAAGSGALRERVLGERWLHLREAGFEAKGPLDPGEVGPRTHEALLRVRTEAEREGELRLSLEALPRQPGTALASFGLGPLPAGLTARVSLDGRLLELALVRPGEVAPVVTAGSAAALPPAAWCEHLVPLLLAPLHDQGLPAELPLRLIGPRGRSPRPATLAVLEASPVERERVVGLVEEDGHLGLEARVGLRGADRGRLLGWRARSAVKGVNTASLQVDATALDAAQAGARRREWGAPEGIPPAPPDPAEAPALARVVQEALDSGRAAAVGERRCWWERPGRSGIAVAFSVSCDASGLDVDLVAQGLRGFDARLRCRLSARTGLTRIQLLPGGWRGSRADLVRGARGLGGEVVCPADSQRPEWRAELELDPDAAPAALVELVLPLLLAPDAPPRAVTCLDEASLDSPFGPELRAGRLAPGWGPAVRELMLSPGEGVERRNQESSAARERSEPREQAGHAAAHAALRTIFLAQRARVARGETATARLDQLLVEEALPPGHQLRVRVYPDGGWLAFAHALELEGQGLSLAIGADGQLRERYGAYAVPHTAELPAEWKPVRK